MFRGFPPKRARLSAIALTLGQQGGKIYWNCVIQRLASALLLSFPTTPSRDQSHASGLAVSRFSMLDSKYHSSRRLQAVPSIAITQFCNGCVQSVSLHEINGDSTLIKPVLTFLFSQRISTC
jgi:hypothetical protein